MSIFGGNPTSLRFGSQTAGLIHVLEEQQVTGVVYGMPYHADGSVSKECWLVEQQAQKLRTAAGPRLPVLLWDESFSTVGAVGHSRVPRPRDAVWAHSVSACIILQEVLQALRAPAFDNSAGGAAPGRAG